MTTLEKQMPKTVDRKHGDERTEVPKPPKYVYKRQIVWFNAIGFLVLHLGAVYGFYVMLTSAKYLTMLWALIVAFIGGFSVTLGTHRLYTHRAFKCTDWLRVLLVLGQTVAGQNCLYVWIRDHRQHHKYSDTNADPHNATRGFFFSHMGWLMVRKHPDVFEKGKTIDMSDIENDPYAMFQKKIENDLKKVNPLLDMGAALNRERWKGILEAAMVLNGPLYYKILFTIFALLIPTCVPCALWGESLWNGFFVCFLFRLIAALNLAWLVNSAAHLYGNKPFTKEMMPAENVFVSIVGLGEGWHNYHHTFPWDYRASEFGQYFNWTTKLIDFFEEMGWVWDKKYATPAMVRSRVTKRGDGTHPRYSQRKKDDDDDDEPVASVEQDGDMYEDLFWPEKRYETVRDAIQKR